jgi:hypothetical protein
MPSRGMLHRVVLVRIDVSEESIISIFKVKMIGELKTLTVTRDRSALVPSSPILVTWMK